MLKNWAVTDAATNSKHWKVIS